MIVNLVSAWTIKPIKLAYPPTFTSKDVTVVIATLGTEKSFLQSLRSIAACRPSEIFIVTPIAQVGPLRKLSNGLGLRNIQVLGAKKANKRLQMIQGLKQSSTAITVFADDDVLWPDKFLVYMLAAFEDPHVGAAGGFNRPCRRGALNAWEFLGAAYLERWNFEIAATSHIDGGIACLAGRTMVVRTDIVQDQGFMKMFISEKWLGRVSLSTADDDNCLTRWMVNQGWKIKIQCADEAALTTELEDSSGFLGQCLRWSRTTWRSNLTSMFVDRNIWRSVSDFSEQIPMAEKQIKQIVIGSSRGLPTPCIYRR